MRKTLAGLAMSVLLGSVVAVGAEPAVGTRIDASTADQVQDLLPPEIYQHFKKGDYSNTLIEFSNDRWGWDDGFVEATKANGERLTLDASKQPVDKTTGQRPEYITGLPFPAIDQTDPD